MVLNTNGDITGHLTTFIHFVLFMISLPSRALPPIWLRRPVCRGHFFVALRCVTMMNEQSRRRQIRPPSHRSECFCGISINYCSSELVCEFALESRLEFCLWPIPTHRQLYTLLQAHPTGINTGRASDELAWCGRFQPAASSHIAVGGWRVLVYMLYHSHTLPFSGWDDNVVEVVYSSFCVRSRQIPMDLSNDFL